MSNNTARKPRSTQVDTIVDLMRDLSRRIGVYEGSEAEYLRETLDRTATSWGGVPPTKRPARKAARRTDLKKDVVVHMVANDLWDFLENPLTVTADAPEGRPVRVQIVDAEGTSALVEATWLQIRR